LAQITDLCEGQPKQLLKLMVDPSAGVAAKNERLTLAAVNKWLDAHAKRQWKPLLPAPKPEHVDPELRAERVAMLKNTAQVIRDTVKAKCVGRPVQVHEPSKLLAALENLEAMRLSIGDENG